MAGEKLLNPKELLTRLKQRNARTNLSKRQQYVAPADAVNQTLRVEGKAPEQTHKKSQVTKEKFQENKNKHTRKVIDNFTKPKQNDLEKADLKAREDAEHQQWVQDYGNGLVDIHGIPLDTEGSSFTTETPNYVDRLTGTEHTIFASPTSEEIKQGINIQNQLFNLQQNNPTEYNRLVLVSNNIINDAQSRLMTPEQINDLYQRFNGRNQLDAEKVARGWDHFETDQERQAKENAVRQNQLSDNFFLNMYGSDPISDEYAKQNPDIANYRFGQNARTAYGVALAPFMGGIFGNSTAGTMFGLGQGFMPFDQLFGTFRRGFQYGGDDAVDAWINGNSGFFDENWASQNPKTALLGNLLGDIYAGKTVNGTSNAISDIRTTWNNALNEAYSRVMSEAYQNVVPSPYNGLEIIGPPRAIEGGQKSLPYKPVAFNSNTVGPSNPKVQETPTVQNIELSDVLPPIKYNSTTSQPLFPEFMPYLHDVTEYVNEDGNKVMKGYVGRYPINLVKSSKSSISQEEALKKIQETVNLLKKYHSNTLNHLDPISRELYLNQEIAKPNPGLFIRNKGDVDLGADQQNYTQLVKQYTRDAIDKFYHSEEYYNRLYNNLLKVYNDPNKVDQIMQTFYTYLENLQEKYFPIMYQDKVTNNGQAWGISPQYGLTTPYLGLNVKPRQYAPLIDILHEFGHLMYDGLRAPDEMWPIIMYNEELMGDPREHVIPNTTLPPGQISYLCNYDELRQRIIPVVREMIDNKWTPEEAYNKSNSLEYAGLKQAFDKEYLITLIGGMLAAPFVVNRFSNAEYKKGGKLVKKKYKFNTNI